MFPSYLTWEIWLCSYAVVLGTYYFDYPLFLASSMVFDWLICHYHYRNEDYWYYDLYQTHLKVSSYLLGQLMISSSFLAHQRNLNVEPPGRYLYLCNVWPRTHLYYFKTGLSCQTLERLMTGQMCCFLLAKHYPWQSLLLLAWRCLSFVKYQLRHLSHWHFHLAWKFS